MATFQLSGTQQPGLMTPLEGEKPTEVAKPKVAESISADQIGATPTFNVPVPKENTSALSRLEASVQPVQTPQQEQPTQEPNQAGDIVQRQLDLIEQARGQGARSAEIMQEQQVLEKKQALDMVDQEINKRENYYERRLQKLEDQGGGLKMGLEAEINTLRRERARELADMYIVRAGKAQDYETANQYAQDLIKAEFEPIQDEIDNLSTVYNLLQNDLSESEKLQAQAQIDQKASDRDLAKSTASQVFSELANAGALTADRTRIINEAMQEASAAISNGQSPDAAIAKMQGALVGVQTLAQQKMALDWAQESRMQTTSQSPVISQYTDAGEKMITLNDGSQINASSIDFDDPRVVDSLPVSDLTKAVMGGFMKTKDLTPTDKSKVASDLQSIGYNPNTYVVKKLEGLLRDYTQLPETSRGVAEGLKFWERWTNPSVAQFESNKAVLTREIARLNDVGVLSDQDVKTYNDAMPSRQDSNIQVSMNKAAGIASSVTGKSPENVGRYVQLPDGRVAIVGLDGDTLLDPTTLDPI